MVQIMIHRYILKEQYVAFMRPKSSTAVQIVSWSHRQEERNIVIEQ